MKELTDLQSWLILSSLLLLEGHDLAGKGTLGMCGPAIKMILATGLRNVDHRSPCQNNGSLEGEATISLTTGIRASWATWKTDEDFKSKCQQKREKSSDATEKLSFMKGSWGTQEKETKNEDHQHCPEETRRKRLQTILRFPDVPIPTNVLTGATELS